MAAIPLRRAGLQLVLNIDYTNTVPFNFLRKLQFLENPDAFLTYTYTVEVLPTALYQVESLQKLDEHVPSHERVRKRKRGINIIINATAHLGAWDLRNCLLVVRSARRL